jgi:hypothetical protein
MIRRSVRVLLVLLAAAVGILSLVPGLDAQAPALLFGEPALVEATLQGRLPLTDDRSAGTVLRSRAASVQFGSLSAAASAGLAGDRSPLLTLNLFDDAVLQAEFERFETDAFGHQTWVGRVSGEPTSTVTLTWKGNVLSGGVQAGEALYRLRAIDGAGIIEQLAPDGFAAELPPLQPPAGALYRPAADDRLRPAAGEVADIYVYYTTAARVEAGGRAAIEALIARGIADSNTTFARSSVQATKRLVGTGEMAGFTQHATDMVADLNAFTGSATVAATRNAVGADLMHLVLATITNACGVAWLGPSSNYAHGVTARGCFGQYTFTHEVGHNFGNNHARSDPVSSSPFRPYSFGYKSCGSSPAFRTVMAYVCPGGGGARILNLSNPTVLHNGLVTGTGTENNALSQSEAFSIVQSFRSGGSAAVPSAPQNLRADVAGNTITVRWQAPATGPPVLTYVVRAGTEQGLSNVFNGAVGAVTAVSSPIPNGTYYIRVLAQGAAGPGPATADLEVKVGAPPGAPQAPAASVSGTTITFSWAPGSGGAVTTYVVQAGSGPGLANVFNGAVGAGTSVSGAVGPGTYYLRVLARGPGGTSAPSAEVTVRVGALCTVPQAPVLSGGRSGNVITMAWTTPSGGPVTGFTVRAGSGAGLNDLYNAAVGMTNRVTAAVGARTYYVRVAANAACGTGPESNEVLVEVP